MFLLQVLLSGNLLLQCAAPLARKELSQAATHRQDSLMSKYLIALYLAGAAYAIPLMEGVFGLSSKIPAACIPRGFPLASDGKPTGNCGQWLTPSHK
jgi:hypothetical protein